MIARPLGLLAAGALVAGGGLLTLGDDTTVGTAPPTMMDGAAVFRAKGCATCHTGPDSTSDFGVAPALDDLAVTAADRVPGLAPEDYVRQSILDPQSFVVQGSYAEMPTLALAPEELDALVAYLLAPRG